MEGGRLNPIEKKYSAPTFLFRIWNFDLDLFLFVIRNSYSYLEHLSQVPVVLLICEVLRLMCILLYNLYLIKVEEIPCWGPHNLILSSRAS